YPVEMGDGVGAMSPRAVVDRQWCDVLPGWHDVPPRTPSDHPVGIARQRWCRRRSCRPPTSSGVLPANVLGSCGGVGGSVPVLSRPPPSRMAVLRVKAQRLTFAVPAL